MLLNRAFHGFVQAKFLFSGSILGFSQFTLLPQAASKNDAQLKSGQNQLENNHLPPLI